MLFDGLITHIGVEEKVGPNSIPKITFVLEEKTTKEIKSSLVIDLMGEKTELLKAYKTGDHVKVYLNSRGSEHNGRRYNTITGWKIEKVA